MSGSMAGMEMKDGSGDGSGDQPQDGVKQDLRIDSSDGELYDAGREKKKSKEDRTKREKRIRRNEMGAIDEQLTAAIYTRLRKNEKG
jgi:hypothetical protein